MTSDGLPTVGVLIPSRGDSAKLARCLEDLAAQSYPPAEVLVGLDGADAQEESAARERYGPLLGGRLQLDAFEKVGYMPIRATLLERTRAEVFLSMNDDVRVGEDFVRAHAAAHSEARRDDSPAVFSGAAPWAEVESPTLFDGAVRANDMIFFRQRPDADGVIGYRECFGLNFSAPVEAARGVGGFASHAQTYGYDDIELAYRLVNDTGAVVRFCAGAEAVHDHRYTPADVMRREYELGRAAWLFRHSSPAFALDLFGRDIASSEELAHWSNVLVRHRRDAERVEATMLALGETPAEAWAASDLGARLIAEHWITLKRYLWGWGLLDGSAGRSARWSLLGEADALP